METDHLDVTMVLGQRLRGAARRHSTDHLVGRRPLDNLGRPYELRLGFTCTSCHWWGETRLWGELLEVCPNCGDHDTDASIGVPEHRWVRADA